MSGERPEISVVVATLARPGRLRGLLRALDAQTLPGDRFEAIVVCDGPDRESERVLGSMAGEVGYRLHPVVAPSQRGPAAARNLGWRRALGGLIAFTDDDCEPSPGWLVHLLEAADGPAMILQGPTTPIPEEDRRVGLPRRTQRIEEPSIWFQTCNIAYPRELLERLDGFDESFREAAGEDADLGWRALDLGAQRRFVTKAGVHHAVEPMDPADLVRQGLRGADSALAFKRHPELRRRGTYRLLFWKRSHARLLAAIAGAALAASTRKPAPLLAVVPYLKGLRGRAAEQGGATVAPALVLGDLVGIVTAVRGGIRHRTPFI